MDVRTIPENASYTQTVNAIRMSLRNLRINLEDSDAEEEQPACTQDSDAEEEQAHLLAKRVQESDMLSVPGASTVANSESGFSLSGFSSCSFGEDSKAAQDQPDNSRFTPGNDDETETRPDPPALDKAKTLDCPPTFAAAYQFFDTLEASNTKNIMVAISCNRKNQEIIDNEYAKEILRYTAEFTTGRICVFIADEVMKYNHLAGGKTKRIALKHALKIGDYFEKLWKKAVAESGGEIAERTHVWRCSDLYTDHHIAKVNETRRIYEEDTEMRRLTYSAAAQLLKWRCPQYTVKEKRVKQILKFMFNEIPMLGLWKEMVLGGIRYEGMIYPAVNPRGMSVVARSAANFDAVLGQPPRFLRVMHLKSIYSEGVLVDIGKQDIEKYFDNAYLNENTSAKKSSSPALVADVGERPAGAA